MGRVSQEGGLKSVDKKSDGRAFQHIPEFRYLRCTGLAAPYPDIPRQTRPHVTGEDRRSAELTRLACNRRLAAYSTTRHRLLPGDADMSAQMSAVDGFSRQSCHVGPVSVVCGVVSESKMSAKRARSGEVGVKRSLELAANTRGCEERRPQRQKGIRCCR